MLAPFRRGNGVGTVELIGGGDPHHLHVGVVAQLFNGVVGLTAGEPLAEGVERVVAQVGRAGQFQTLWTSMEELLVTYNEKPYVSDVYRAALDGVGGRAERMAVVDLPPEIGDWLDTLGQESVRRLSVQMLIDLRGIESDAKRAGEIADDMGALGEDLLMAGAYDDTASVVGALVSRGGTATAIGRGEVPPRVAEAGPTEVRTLASAFNQMSADLQRADSERALLLAGVSHDLRTPLARIRLSVEMLDDKTDDTIRSGMVQDVEDIDAVINQFLDFARVTAESSNRSDADLNEIVESVVERNARQGRNVTARTSPLPRMQLDRMAMQRVVTNLVENALRHGSTEVEIETAAPPGRVRLSVLDRGPGIPPEDAERMLQPFTRMNEARSTVGSGLGLAIVDRIARMHGGKVQLLPREGGGLEARIEFELAAVRTAPSSAPHAH